MNPMLINDDFQDNVSLMVKIYNCKERHLKLAWTSSLYILMHENAVKCLYLFCSGCNQSWPKYLSRFIYRTFFVLLAVSYAPVLHCAISFWTVFTNYFYRAPSATILFIYKSCLFWLFNILHVKSNIWIYFFLIDFIVDKRWAHTISNWHLWVVAIALYIIAFFYKTSKKLSFRPFIFRICHNTG